MPDCCIRVTEAVGGKPQCPALASWRWLKRPGSAGSAPRPQPACLAASQGHGERGDEDQQGEGNAPGETPILRSLDDAEAHGRQQAEDQQGTGEYQENPGARDDSEEGTHGTLIYPSPAADKMTL